MEVCRAVASLTVPGGQEFHFPHFFLKFQSIFPTFPQTLLIFFLILALRVSDSPTQEGPGYATGSVILRKPPLKFPIPIVLDLISYRKCGIFCQKMFENIIRVCEKQNLKIDR